MSRRNTILVGLLILSGLVILFFSWARDIDSPSSTSSSTDEKPLGERKRSPRSVENTASQIPSDEPPAIVESSDSSDLAPTENAITEWQTPREILDLVSPSKSRTQHQRINESTLNELHTSLNWHGGLGREVGLSSFVDLVEGESARKLFKGVDLTTARGMPPGYAKRLKIEWFSISSDPLQNSLEVTIEELPSRTRYKTVLTLSGSTGALSHHQSHAYPDRSATQWLQGTVLLPRRETDVDYLVYDSEENPRAVGFARAFDETVQLVQGEEPRLGNLRIVDSKGQPIVGALITGHGQVYGRTNNDGVSAFPLATKSDRNRMFVIHADGMCSQSFLHDYWENPDQKNFVTMLFLPEARVSVQLDDSIPEFWPVSPVPRPYAKGGYLGNRWPAAVPKELHAYSLSTSRILFFTKNSPKTLPSLMSRMGRELPIEWEFTSWHRCAESILLAALSTKGLLTKKSRSDLHQLKFSGQEALNAIIASIEQGPTKTGNWLIRTPKVSGTLVVVAIPVRPSSTAPEGNPIFFELDWDTANNSQQLTLKRVDPAREYKVIRSSEPHESGDAWLRYYFGDQGAKAEHGVPENPAPEPWPAKKPE